MQVLRMKAVVCTGPGGSNVLKVDSVPDPTAGRGEVVILVKDTALNGADMLQRRGVYPPPPGALQHSRR